MRRNLKLPVSFYPALLQDNYFERLYPGAEQYRTIIFQWYLQSCSELIKKYSLHQRNHFGEDFCLNLAYTRVPLREWKSTEKQIGNIRHRNESLFFLPPSTKTMHAEVCKFCSIRQSLRLFLPLNTVLIRSVCVYFDLV